MPLVEREQGNFISSSKGLCASANFSETVSGVYRKRVPNGRDEVLRCTAGMFVKPKEQKE